MPIDARRKGKNSGTRFGDKSEPMAQLTAITRELAGLRGQPKKVAEGILSEQRAVRRARVIRDTAAAAIDPTSTVTEIPGQSTVFKPALSR